MAGVVMTLAIAGRGFEAVIEPLRLRAPAQVSASALTSSPGAGALLGWLGGFRALAADFLWLKMHAGWENRDLPETEALLRLTSAVDASPVYFWLNGARIIAYDFPAWRIEAEGGYGKVSRERQLEIDAEQGRRAIERIVAARRHHPENAALWIEQANIELNRVRNPAAAAESYRRAALLPEAPPYAARLHGELLRRLGRKAEAYAWLRGLHPTLRRDDEGANWAVVLARIRELERELAVPPDGVYEPRLE